MRTRQEMVEVIDAWNKWEFEAFDRIINKQVEEGDAKAAHQMHGTKWVRYNEVAMLVWALDDSTVTARWGNT